MTQVFLIFALWMATLCANVGAMAIEPANQGAPAVACKYEMIVGDRNKTEPASKHFWYFWRAADTLQTRNDETGQGEIWERDEHGRVYYRRLYHTDKTAVEYMPADNQAQNIRFDWASLSGMFTTSDLAKLPIVNHEQAFGSEAELHKGEVAGAALEVLWLPEHAVPARIKKVANDQAVEMKLIEIEPLAKATVQPVSLAEINLYRQIDYADFGDMESDPFVKKLLRQENHFHAH